MTNLQCARACSDPWLLERIVTPTAWCRDETMLLQAGRPTATAKGVGFHFRFWFAWFAWVEGEVGVPSLAAVTHGPSSYA